MSKSESRLDLERAGSTAKLDLRDVGKNGCSISPLGDSNAFGIAGTGGTSSSSVTTTCSTRGLGVGSREDEDGVCDCLVCTELAEFLAELAALGVKDSPDV